MILFKKKVFWLFVYWVTQMFVLLALLYKQINEINCRNLYTNYLHKERKIPNVYVYAYAFWNRYFLRPTFYSYV